MAAKTLQKTLIAAAAEGSTAQTRSPGMHVNMSATDAARVNDALGKAAGIGDSMADSLTSIRTKRKTSGKKVVSIAPAIDEAAKKKKAAEVARGQHVAGEIIRHAEKESAGWKGTLETILLMTPVERAAMRMSVGSEQRSVKSEDGKGKLKLADANFSNKERLAVLRLQNRSAYQRVSELMSFSKACDDGLNSKTMVEAEWRRVFGQRAAWDSMSMHQIIACGREYRRRIAEAKGETPKQRNKGQSPEKKLRLLILRAVANGTIKVGDLKKHLPDVSKWATDVIGNVKHAGKLLAAEQKGITGAKATV